MKTLFATLSVGVLALGLTASLPAQEGAKEDIKEAGRSTKHAVKKTGHAIAEGTEDAAHDTAHAAKKTGHAIKHGTKRAVHATASGAEKGADKIKEKTQ